MLNTFRGGKESSRKTSCSLYDGKPYLWFKNIDVGLKEITFHGEIRKYLKYYLCLRLYDIPNISSSISFFFFLFAFLFPRTQGAVPYTYYTWFINNITVLVLKLLMSTMKSTLNILIEINQEFFSNFLLFYFN